MKKRFSIPLCKKISLLMISIFFITSINIGNIGIFGARNIDAADNTESRILFSDDFEDGNDIGWIKGEGTWSVVDDVYGNKAYHQANAEGGSQAYAGNDAWGDYQFETDFIPRSGQGGTTILFRAKDAWACYQLWITQNGISLGENSSDSAVDKVTGWYGTTIEDNVKHTVKIDVKGNNISVYLDGGEVAIITAADPNNTYPTGKIGLSSWNKASDFDNVVACGAFEENGNSDAVLAALNGIEEDYQGLKTSLDLYDNQDLKPRAIIASAEVIKTYLDIIPSDLNQGLIEIAEKEVTQVRDVLDNAIADLASGNFELTSEKSVKGLNITNGHFQNGEGESIFPRGIIWFDQYANPGTADGLEILKNAGLNIIDTYWTTPSIDFPVEGGSPEDSTYLTELVQCAYDNNLLLDILAQPDYLPDWFKTKYPEALPEVDEWRMKYDLENQDVRNLLKEYIQYHITNLLQKSDILADTVLGIDLANEPSTDCITAVTLQNFRALMAKKYVTIEAFNNKWGTSFISFEDINDAASLRALILSNTDVLYDWNQYSFDRFTEYFKWFGEAIDEYSDNVKFNKFVKTPENYSMLDADDSNFMARINLDMLSSTTNILGTDTFIDDRASDIYNLNWLKQSFLFDMYKSFGKDKPIYDAEWHSVDSVYYQNKNIDQGYMREALRLATWHGLSGTSLWTYARAGNASWYYDGANLMGQPRVLNEYLTEAQAIDNEMDRVSLFPQTDRKIGILFSMSSILRDGQKYLNPLKDIYQAFYFLDSNLGIITEDMLENNDLSKLELLVIPNAKYIEKSAFDKIKELSANGVKIIMIGASFQYDEEGKALVNAALTGPVKRINVSNIDDYFQKASGLMKWANTSDKHRLIDGNMEHPAYIEARFAEMENGDKIGYAINLGNEAKTFAIVNTATGKSVGIKEYKNGKVNDTSVSEVTLGPKEYISFNIGSDEDSLPYDFTWDQAVASVADVPDEEIVDSSDTEATVPVDALVAKNPPIIDGDLSDWDNTAAIKLNDSTQVKGITNWKASDLSAEGRLRWDSNNLYVGISVKDDVHSQPKTSGDIWQGDSIQIGIDPAKDGGHAANAFIEMGFAITDDGAVQKYRWGTLGDLPTGDLDNVDCAIVRDEANKITTYEISIPWSEIAYDQNMVENGSVLGFSMLVNDNDGSGREGYIEYYSGIGSTKNSTAFGTLTLREKVITAINPVKVNTNVNTLPVLPDEVAVTYNDGSTMNASVLWDNIESYLYSDVGTFKVKGSVEGTSLKVIAEVTVVADKTAPNVQVPGFTDGEIITLGTPVSVSWNASDDGSGLATASSGSIDLDTSIPGKHTYTISAADNAGNNTDLQLTYYVIYQYNGVLQPINTDGSSIFAAGSTIPVKFSLADADKKYVSNALGRLYISKIGDDGLINDEVAAVSSGLKNVSNKFRYDYTGSQYIYNLSTRNMKLIKGYYQIRIELDDEQSYTAKFYLK